MKSAIERHRRWLFAVGTALATGPPRRSQRALLGSSLVALCRSYKDTELATPRPTSGSPTSCISPSTRSRQLRTLFGYFGVEHLAQNQKRSYLVMRAL